MGASCSNQIAVYNVKQNAKVLVMMNADLITLILSFVATAPQHSTVVQSLGFDFSRIPSIGSTKYPLTFQYQPFSATLTEELPMVCQCFWGICYTSDLLWMDALATSLVTQEWNLEEMLQEWNCGDLISLIPNTKNEASPPSLQDMKRALYVLCKELSAPHLRIRSNIQGMSMARYLYKQLWKRATVTLPAVFQPTRYTDLIGETMDLQLTEPRYQVMIADLVKDHHVNPKTSMVTLTKHSYPVFMFVPQPVDGPEPIGYVTLIKRCKLYGDGTADVTVVPVQRKRIIRSERRSYGDGLLDVTAVRV